ncbi:SWIM zinc finger family protein [uncultured Dialister sp.]
MSFRRCSCRMWQRELRNLCR